MSLHRHQVTSNIVKVKIYRYQAIKQKEQSKLKIQRTSCHYKIKW